MITQEELKRTLSYDKETGIFKWIKFHRRTKNKQEAGSNHSCGYRRIHVGGKTYFAHRLAWLYVYGKLPSGQIDHLDHNRKNNAINNLRDVTVTDNQRNKSLGVKNYSGKLGVSYVDQNRKWQAQISHNGKTVYIGRYLTKEEAIKARVDAEKKYLYHENHS